MTFLVLLGFQGIFKKKNFNFVKDGKMKIKKIHFVINKKLNFLFKKRINNLKFQKNCEFFKKPRQKQDKKFEFKFEQERQVTGFCSDVTKLQIQNYLTGLRFK